MKKLILIDGNAIFHRAFHALPLLTNSKNEHTNAILGFIRMLFDVIRNEKPDYVAIAFDHKEKTFRHIEYTEYKANRSAPPPELYPQMPRLKELLKAFNFAVFEMQGFEADDIIGTLSLQAEANPDLQTIILTGDKDAFQLITNHTFVMTPKMGFSVVKIYDQAGVKEAMGVTPEQIIDYKALRGDSSDNIPGVKGIGEKQAVEMLAKFGTLENIYNHLDELTESQRKKMEESRDIALMSKKLATIIRDMPISLNLDICQLPKVPLEKAVNALDELEFASLSRNIHKFTQIIEQPESSQITMF